MRIAYLGPLPSTTSGVPYVARVLLTELAAAGCEITCFVAAAQHEIPRDLSPVGFRSEPVRWDWNRWYSRSPLSAFVTGQSARARAQRRLIAGLVEEHRCTPFDVVYQFSQLELLGLGAKAASLPPIVVHPEVHAQGELYWHRRERALALRGGSAARHAAVTAMLAVRSVIQRRGARRAALVITPSAVFGRQVARDCRVDPERIRVVPNPIDLDRMAFAEPPAPAPVRLLYVSRLGVRKGVDMIVELSRRLADLEGRVQIDVIGDRSLWSDYSALLEDLDGRVARYIGPRSAEQMPEEYRAAHALLQPSYYEPFGLTVGEALSCGRPVVASDVTGAAEGLSPDVCRTFAAGDADGFEHAVRALVDDLGRDGPRLARAARAEAEQRFAAAPTAARLLDALRQAAAR